jgi:capsular polysaccharide biosynthesis protein
MTIKAENEEKQIVIKVWTLQLLIPICITLGGIFVGFYINDQKYSMKIDQLELKVNELNTNKLDKVYFNDIQNRLQRIENKLDKIQIK